MRTERGGDEDMFVIAKVLLVALALTGVTGTGLAAGVVHMPLQKAIDIHREHLGQNTTMPMKSQKGQQNALDHLLGNLQRLVSTHNVTRVPDTNETG